VSEGENPWRVNIIDYYGPGCTSPGGSKDWLAILPEENEGETDEKKRFRLRYANLDQIAFGFAVRKGITIIFNHASTAALYKYPEDGIFNNDEDRLKYGFLEEDINGKGDPNKYGFKSQRFLMELENLEGIAVLINIKYGENKNDCVKSEKELYRHI